MALRKLDLLPDSSNYTVKEGDDAISVTLDGGLPRQRLAVLDAAKTVECQWSLNRQSYDYFRAFYKLYTDLSGVAFLIDLIIDDSVIEEHTAFFEPGSVRLNEQRGHLYVMRAILQVKPIVRTIGYNEAIVVLFEQYGEATDTEFASVASLLETLMNTTLPAI